MLRFAPSPTEDLHINNLRLALFNYILSHQNNEELIIRMEDIDESRNIEGKDKEIAGLLGLFGISYRDVTYQSAYLKYHRSMAIQLLHEKIAFNCFCTPQMLQAKKNEALKANIPYRYDDACLSLTPEQTIDNELPFTVRLRKPNVNVVFTDIIKGECSYAPEDIDSFVILETDKRPSYNFACAVDDMLSDISLVIRSDKYLDETPKQIAARAALNYTKEITYAHVPDLCDAKGQRLNEEHKGYDVKWLLEEGFLPSAIVNYLILLGNETPQETFTLDEAVKWFDLSKLSKEPAIFDLNDLRKINQLHLAALDDTELSRYVGFADADIGQLAKLYLDRVSTTKELRETVCAIFESKVIPEALQADVDRIRNILTDAPFFETYDKLLKFLIQESTLTEEALLPVLRYLLCGSEETPELSLVYAHIKNYLSEIIK